MRYLVTGASGFIGGAVARRALAEGDEVTAFVRDADRAAALEEAGARICIGSVGDPNEVADAAKGAEVVIHCAAVRSHRASERALRWVNVAGTENVTNAAEHARCARVVVVSCGDVTLSNTDRVNWNEDKHFIGQPLDAHARSKKLAEEVALTRLSAHLEVTAVRPPAWVWGPGDTSVLPALCAEGLADGGIQMIGSGESFICTMYIDNLVDAILSAGEVSAAPGLAYYVSDNELLEAREFFRDLSAAAGLPAPRTGTPYGMAYALAFARAKIGGAGLHPTDVVHRGRPCHFDVAKAVHELDWEPRVKMAEGMKALAEWVKSEGGPEALAKRVRPPATDADVDAQVAAAGGD